MTERREVEDELRLSAVREAVEAGIADIAAGRFRVFDSAVALREGLSAIAAEVLDREARSSG